MDMEEYPVLETSADCLHLWCRINEFEESFEETVELVALENAVKYQPGHFSHHPSRGQLDFLFLCQNRPLLEIAILPSQGLSDPGLKTLC